jgi:hypothetical protein
LNDNPVALGGGRADDGELRAAAEEATAWLESRPDWTEGDAATASRLRAALGVPTADERTKVRG